jgi:DNA topoisomerase-1
MALTEITSTDAPVKVLAVRSADGTPTSAIKLARRLGLHYLSTDALKLRRRRSGTGFSYCDPDGKTISDANTLKRLKSLAVPPAYEDVLYAEDPKAHIQAIGRDAAGRLQYRYHPEWQKVRETRKAQRLARLAEALPRIRRSVGQHLTGAEARREFALAAVIELVARSAIRPGSENHARLRGTRGAATLLKSNVVVVGDTITLKFRAKGGKNVVKEFSAPRLCEALAVLRKLPGRRLFQYQTEAGDVRHVTAQDVNTFLREIAGVQISLKDFRTLLASVSVLDALAREAPAESKRARRRQVLEAISAAADDLANTPAICAKSYVHETVVAAFEDGILEQFAATLRSCRSTSGREKVLAEVIATAAAA